MTKMLEIPELKELYGKFELTLPGWYSAIGLK